MAKSSNSAQSVFEHAECFYQTFMALCRLRPDPREDMHATITLAEPVIVLAAFANELFLKCIICIETGDTMKGHNLKKLFARISDLPALASRGFGMTLLSSVDGKSGIGLRDLVSR
jgi:hypothetical protein